MDVNKALELIQKMARWCISEGMVLSPYLPSLKRPIEVIKEASTDFKCWKRTDRGSVEIFVSKELIQQVFKE
jgi:hypothetical protein